MENYYLLTWPNVTVVVWYFYKETQLSERGFT